MDVAVFSTHWHDRHFLQQAAADRGIAFTWLEPRLAIETAPLAEGVEAVSVFVHDLVDAQVLRRLSSTGVRMIALRCAGFNNVDVVMAARLGITIARVPAYSPHAVAEHTVGLMLSLNRKFHRAWQRVREGNFSLDGLLGFDMRGRTVGVVGTGRIGAVTAEILLGFGCVVLAHDTRVNPELQARGVRYTTLDTLLAESDIVTLHCPLTPATRHLIGRRALARMKPGVMVINTSRGGLLDARAAIEALKSGRLGSLGLDVYEEEADLFYENLSDRVLQDDVLARLLTFPNVLITAHQAFFTQEAVTAIAETTVENLLGWHDGRMRPENLVTPAMVQPAPTPAVMR